MLKNRATNNYGISSWSDIWKFQTIDNLYITGSVVFDKNNNLLKDSGDPGMAGWKIFLQGPVNDTIVTKTDGSFTFSNLLAGTYTVREYILPGWSLSVPSQPQVYSIRLDTTKTFAVCNFLNYSPNAGKFDFLDGWNLISLPMNVVSNKLKDVFLSTAPLAFYYNGSYISSDTFTFGLGYWLKFPQAQSVWISGTLVLKDTFDLSIGWNLMGSLSDTVLAESLTTTPNNIIASYIFGFNGTLLSVDTLLPGKGYWIKTNQAGKLILSNAVQVFTKTENDNQSFDVMNSLTFCSDDLKKQKIFFSENINSKNLITRATLPPPMDGVFDVRFSDRMNTGSFAALIEESKLINVALPITVRSASYPLTVQWQIVDKGVSYQLELNNGQKIILEGSGETILAKNFDKSENYQDKFSLTILKHAEYDLPTSFEVAQNYPNPFNNNTSISISLPINSHVRLEVYNILGESVAVWLDKNIDAGYHIFNFDASALTSGVYYYRMTTNGSTGGQIIQPRRMILVK